MNTQPTKQQMREYLISHIIDEMVKYFINDEGISLEAALDKLYRSKTIQLLQLPEGELYVQSPSYVYELYQQIDKVQYDQLQQISNNNPHIRPQRHDDNI